MPPKSHQTFWRLFHAVYFRLTAKMSVVWLMQIRFLNTYFAGEVVMIRDEALNLLAQKAFAYAILHAIRLSIAIDEVYLEDGSVSLSFSCFWKRGEEEHIEGKCFLETKSSYLIERFGAFSATVVIDVVALYEGEKIRRQFLRQNFYVRCLDAEEPEVVSAW